MENIEQKKVSIPLGIGIFFFPIIFAWFTLRKEYSAFARVVSFGWLLAGIVAFVLLPNTAVDSKAVPDGAVKVSMDDKAIVFEPEPVQATYKVIKDEATRNVNRVVEVELSERVSEDKIAEIANKIKAADKKTYERTFVLFSIPDVKGSAWATASFDPDLKINIVGSSKTDHEKLDAKPVIAEGKVIGQWHADWGFEYKVIYEEKDGKVFKREIFSDAESKPVEMHLVKINGREAYQEEDDKERGEYYIINKDGDLEYWSKNGNYYTAKKVA